MKPIQFAARIAALAMALGFFSPPAMAQSETSHNDQTSVEATQESTASEQPDPGLGVVVEYAEDALPEETESASDRPAATRTDSLESVVNFVGYLKQKGKRNPIADVTVYLKDHAETAVSDVNGRFVFSTLAPGSYTVVIPTTDYETVETDEQIVAGERTEVVYYLEPRVYSGLQVVVRGKRVQKEVSRTVLPVQEAALIPGSGGDPLRSLESLPSVARGMGGGYQDLVIRGSNAEDSKIYLDGHELPGLFHFGGLKSTYNAKLIDRFELYAGGFPAKWGLATGGVVEIETREPREDRWGGYADLSMIDLSALAEGPITDELSVAAAARRSTVDWIMEAIDLNDMVDGLAFSSYPVYYDYQLKLQQKFDRRHRLTLDVYGGYDGMEMNLDLVDDSDPVLTGLFDMDIDFESVFSHYLFDGDWFKSDLSPGYSRFAQVATLGEKFLKIYYHQLEVNEDARFELSQGQVTEVGLRVQPRFFQVESDFIRPPKEGDLDPSFTNDERIVAQLDEGDVIVSTYLQQEMVFGPFTLVPGVHLDYESVLQEYAVDPRATVRYRLFEPLTLKTGGGIYHRVPEVDEIIEPWGNSDLELERAFHAIGGFEWSITDSIVLDVQGYYKYLDHLVTPVRDPESDQVYDNSAEGTVIGGEFLLRHNFGDRFFGWLSYSISRSLRNDGAGTPDRPFDMDQRHNLVAVASWEFAKGYRLGGRFQFTSGEPYTRVLGSVFNADTGTYLPVYEASKKNAYTRPPYHRFDLRFDKEWLFDAWVLSTYIDVRNVYLHANPVETIYNYDFGEQTHLTDIPILVSLGVTAEF